MELAFNVKVHERNGIMKLEGSLNDILKAEAYLDSEFPKFPDIQVCSDNQTPLLSLNDRPSQTQKQRAKETSEQNEGITERPHIAAKGGLVYNDSGNSAPSKFPGVVTGGTGRMSKNNQSLLHKNEGNQTQNQHKIEGSSHGPTKGTHYQFDKISVYVYESDITTVPTDIIVCTDDNHFTHNFGLSKHISAKACQGNVQKWLQLLNEGPPFADNMCFETPAGWLNYQCIIHVIRPKELENIHISISNSLHLCDRKEIVKAAIPTIGTG